MKISDHQYITLVYRVLHTLWNTNGRQLQAQFIRWVVEHDHEGGTRRQSDFRTILVICTAMILVCRGHPVFLHFMSDDSTLESYDTAVRLLENQYKTFGWKSTSMKSTGSLCWCIFQIWFELPVSGRHLCYTSCVPTPWICPSQPKSRLEMLDW